MTHRFSIREAKFREADQVIEMIERLHEEARDFGGLVRKGARTTRWLRTVVGEAIGRKAGLVLVALNLEDQLVGALVAADTDLPYDSEFSKLAAGLGTYVSPNYRKAGVAGALYTEARKLLTERGYDGYLGAHLVGNDRAARVIDRAGFEPVETSVLMRLKE